jgi:hypothetical protein
MVGLLAVVGCSAPAMTRSEIDAENVGSTGEALFANPDLYTKLKAAEAAMPRPCASATGDVGTLDALTGDFAGHRTMTRLVNYKPVTSPAYLNVVGIRAVLTWEAKNRGTLPFSVVVNGVTHTAPAGATQISVDVGAATKVVWTEKVGTESFGDTLNVTRYGLNGIGAYTVPVVPVTIIFEPPQDAAKTNAAWMSDVDTSSTTTAIASSTDTNTTQTSSSTHSVIDNLKDLAPVVDAIEAVFPAASDVASKLGSVSALFGTHTDTYTDGTTVSNKSEIDITNTKMKTWSTSQHLGPGQGDVAVYLRNARFAWVMKDGVISQSLFDYEQLGRVSVSILGADLADLRANPTLSLGSRTGLSAESLTTLLALDPFVAGGANAVLPASRFAFVGSYTVGGSNGASSQTYSVQNTDLSSTTTYRTTVTDDTSGLLSILGIGVTTDGHEQTTVTQTTSHSISAGSAVTAAYSLNSVSDVYTIDVYYDRLFGNFAYRTGTL